MAVTVEQEPYKTLRDRIFGQAILIAMLATDKEDDPWAAFNQPPDSDKEFPKFIWSQSSGAGEPGVDVEAYDMHRDRLTLSFWTPEPEDFMDATHAINVLQDDWLAGTWDSEHWKCKGFRRQTSWQKIAWDGKGGRSILIEGVPLFQFVSDWEYRFNRRQDVV